MNSSSNTNYDVIVVGGGGSGLAAACSAAELGGKVLLLEKQSQLGGTTGIAVGSFTASSTSLQRDAGFKDDPNDHDEDAGRFAAPEIEVRNNCELRKYFLSESAETFEWLLGLGLSFYGPSPEPPNRVPRMHNVVPGAKAYIAALQMHFQRCGGDIWCSCSVDQLLLQGQRVAGVRATTNGRTMEFYAARGVVLAAGDYASAVDLIERHKGRRFSNVEGINRNATGDGHRLLAQVGGELVNMDVVYGPELRFVPPSRTPFTQLLPVGRLSARIMATIVELLPRWVISRLIKRLLVTWQHPEDRLFQDGAILVNARGERFTNERHPSEREIDVTAQPERICYILLDGRLAERYSSWPYFISTAPDIAYAYMHDYRRLRPDITTVAHSLTELERYQAMVTGRLTESVESFNRYANGYSVDVFGRTGDIHPLTRSPWILLGPVKAYFTTTEGGASVNHQLQVLDNMGNPIPGLYAVGQNGLGGMVLWGHGLHIAWAITSGRLVGRTLMQN